MFKRFAIVGGVELLDAPPSKKYSINSKTVTKANDLSGDGAKEVTAFEMDTENFLYFRCRAISADIPNGNGDMFPEPELIKAAKSFVGVGMYRDHDADSVDKSVGKVLWAEWVPEGKYIECYCCIDKKLSPDLARRIETGQANTVSMGCMVGEAECGICSNIARNAMELCDHMIPGRGIKGRRGADGKIAHEINRMLQFTELSLVTVPADPTAHIFEVYAAHKAGRITADELRQYVTAELSKLVPAFISDAVKTDKISNGATTTERVSNAPALNPEPAVVKIVDSQEERMKLDITYHFGPTLASSFFVAKEAGVEFKCTAAEVLPLFVQEAIMKDDPSVSHPDVIVAELKEKCPTLAEFKKWAKKRKKKNRHALENLQKMKGDEKGEEKPGEKPNPFEKHEEKKADVGAPVLEAPAAAAPALTPAADAPAAMAPGAPAAEAPAPAGLNLDEKGIDEVQNMIKDLQKVLVEKQQAAASAASAPVKTAVKTEENVMDKRDNGASNGKAQPEKMPSGQQEVSKTENPSGHMDKGASLKTTAGEKDKAIWSLNEKELEKPGKEGKKQQAMPPAGHMSLEEKEMKSEEVKHDGGSHASKVKQYFGRLPSKGPGEAPKALDMKSSVDETVSLRKALAEKEEQLKAIQAKEQQSQIVSRVADVVAALAEKDLITAEKQDEVIKLLTSKFASLETLDGICTLVSHLTVSKTAATTPAESPIAEDLGGQAPQVFETVNDGEDAITMMSRLWNI